MDQELIDRFRQAGAPVEEPMLLELLIEVGRNGRDIITRGDMWPVKWGSVILETSFAPLGKLLAPGHAPPDLRDDRAPPDRYLPFLASMERTAVNYCLAQERPETDAEMERLYRQLRRRPDGADGHPLFAPLQATARAQASVQQLNVGELEYLLQMLCRSARRRMTHPGSTNYATSVLLPLAGRPSWN